MTRHELAKRAALVGATVDGNRAIHARASGEEDEMMDDVKKAARAIAAHAQNISRAGLPHDSEFAVSEYEAVLLAALTAPRPSGVTSSVLREDAAAVEGGDRASDDPVCEHCDEPITVDQRAVTTWDDVTLHSECAAALWPVHARIEDASPTLRRIDGAEVARALGAEQVRPSGEREAPRATTNPVNTWTVTTRETRDVAALTAQLAEAQRERDEAKEWADLVARGKSPCGHWKAYAYTEDGGKHIHCLSCEVTALREALWGPLTTLRRASDACDADNLDAASDYIRAAVRAILDLLGGQPHTASPKPEHVCGVRGFAEAALEHGDRCPACEASGRYRGGQPPTGGQ